MEREIGKWNKATGITRPVKGQKEWVELWIGDVIKCRVYITDRAGGYLWIDEAEVLWEEDYGQYSIIARYYSNGKVVTGIFALREVLRRDIEFIRKVPRFHGNQRDIIFEIVEMMGAYKQEPNGETVEQAMATIVAEIASWNIVPSLEILEIFKRER